MYCLAYFIVSFALVIQGASGTRIINDYNELMELWNYYPFPELINNFEDIGDAIVGGDYAKPGEIPYQVALLYNNRHLCGGSILGSCWILTAAHCVVGFSVERLSILAGTINLKKGGVRVRINQVISHKNYYKPTLANDIALIKLKQCLSYNKNIQPVSLLTANINPGTFGVVSGWGYTDHHGSQTTNDLKKLVVTTISNQRCSKFYVKDTIRYGSICTFNSKVGFCQGDSGGPLVEVKSRMLMGLVSGNRGCAQGVPDIYTRISTYIPWIKSVVL